MERQHQLEKELKQNWNQLLVNHKHVADTKSELIEAVDYGQSLIDEGSQNWVEKFNAERSRNAVNPFD